jgi:hypothetical protein
MRTVTASFALFVALSMAPVLAQQSQDTSDQSSEGAEQPTQGTVESVTLDQHARLAGTTCNPTHVSFSGKIKTDGPTFVTYRWVKSDGTRKDGVLQFTKRDGRTITTHWDQTSTFTGWVRLIVLTPKHVETPKTYFRVHCGTS